MAGAGGDKTEAPTPKRLQEAKKKGQVAKSQDLNGATVMLVGLMVLGAAGPGMVEHMRAVMVGSFNQASAPSVVSMGSLGKVLIGAGTHLLLAVAPVALACALAGVVVNVGQAGL